MSQPSAESLAVVKAMLEGARQEIGVHAVRAVEGAGFQQRNERAMAAMVVLIAAAREVSEAMGMRELFMAMCAAEVPSSVVNGEMSSLI